MSAEHHHFVGLVGARDFGDDVIRSTSFGMGPVDDIEFELDSTFVAKQPPDAAVVLVAHDDSGRCLRQIEITVLCNAGATKRPDLSMIPAGVVNTDQRTVCDEKLIELLLNLVVRQRLWFAVALLLLLWLLLLRTLCRWLIQLREHV